MARPRRIIVPLEAEAIATRTEDVAEIPAAPQRSLARQKLADTIATVASLEAEIAEAKAAVNEADQAKWRTVAALRDAEDDLERAKPQPSGSGGLKRREPWTFASQEDADAYNAKLNEPPPSIEWAKEAVAKATDARDSALAALQFHQGRLDKATTGISWRRSNIEEAVRLAVHWDPAMVALAAETKRLVTAAAASRRAFEDAVGTSMMQPDHRFYGTTNPTDFRTDPEGWGVVHRWREALEDLRRDPDAPLPMPA